MLANPGPNAGLDPGRRLRWLVTGAGGLLGRDLVDVLRLRGEVDVLAPARGQLDVTDAAAARAAVQGRDVVVNAAAWTDVDGAEAAAAAAARVNADGPRHLAAACAAEGAALVHLSTDYVFAGDASAPYPEDALPAPRTAYGRGKAAGERAVLETLPGAGYVVRTAWLYGEHGASFPTTLLRLARERDAVDVVDDQHGQPTWSREVAERIVTLVRASAPPGIYHATNAGQTTWYGFSRALLREVGADPNRVRPTTTERFPRPARRPAYSVLGHGRWAAAGLPPLRDWRVALAAAVRAGALPTAAGVGPPAGDLPPR